MTTLRGAKRTIGFTVCAATLALVPAGAAKGPFKPGDIRVCNTRQCVAVRDSSALKAFSSFYYGGPQPARVSAPRLGSRAFALEFGNGYVTGIAASAQLDRFLSYGVVIERFHRGVWYRLPAAAARELRRLTVALRPLRVTHAALAKSR
jgi:hypothetical protein